MEKEGMNNSEVKSYSHKSTCAKVIETGFLVATWLALGLYLEIFGPTLIDLKIKYNTDYESVAVAVSGRSVGLFPGCVVGGLLVDKFGKYCHLMLALCLEIAALVTALIPWCSDVRLLWFLCFVGGFVESVINIAGQRLILKLWLEKAATPMILLHSGYGFGSFLIPLYTDPFLAVKRPDADNTTASNASTTTMPHHSVSTTTASEQPEVLSEYIKESQIEYSYAISAALVAAHSLAFYVFQIRERRFQKAEKDIVNKKTDLQKTFKNENRTFLQMINPATCAGGRLFYGIQLFVLLFFYFANAGGGERVVAGFVRSFSIDQLNFSKSDGSYINTAFWISFAVGRIGFSIAARWISIRVLIIIQTGGLTLVAVLLNIFARSNQMAYWVLIQPLGIFIAPLWPSGVAWTDYHLELTGMGMMVILLGGSVGGIGHLRLIGYLYEHIGYYTFLYQVLGYGIFALAIAIVLDLVGAQHGSRFTWDKTEYVQAVNMKKL